MTSRASVPTYTIKSRPDVAAPSAARLRRSGLRPRIDAGVHGRPLRGGAAAFHDPRHARSGDSDLREPGTFRRCPRRSAAMQLGATVKRALESWPEQLRVVVIGSGSFSLEVFGPRIAPGKSDGVPDPDWAKRVCALIWSRRSIETLLAEATSRADAGRPAMSAASSSTGSPCSARSASASPNSSRRRWSRGTPTPPGDGAEPCRSTP